MRKEKDSFRPVQRWMAETALRLKRVYFGAEVGFGKTAACLKVVDLLDRSLDLVGKVLIVAPYHVAVNTWPDEIGEWDFSQRFTYTLLTGLTPHERNIARQDDSMIHIINFENFVWLYRQFSAEKRWPYQVLIFDEASRLGGGKKRTARVKLKKPDKDGRHFTGRRLSAFGALANRVNNFEYVIELSGTPGARGFSRLWGPMFMIDGGQRLGTSRSAFEDRFFTKMEHALVVREGAEEEIMSRITDRFFSLKRTDFDIDAPDLATPIDKWVKLPEPLMKKYRKFEREAYLEDFDIDALNRGVLINKLLQFANGHIYDHRGTAHRIHDIKFKMLESVFEDIFDEPILIAYPFEFDRAELKRRYPTARFFGENRDDIKDWNAGRITRLFAHPAQMAHGLNLQFSGRFLGWFGLTWSLELYQQFNGRLARPGSKADVVTPIRILMKGTEDVRQARKLIEKSTTQDRIIDAVRVYRDRLLG